MYVKTVVSMLHTKYIVVSAGHTALMLNFKFERMNVGQKHTCLSRMS
jgi:hypothetical protein